MLFLMYMGAIALFMYTVSADNIAAPVIRLAANDSALRFVGRRFSLNDKALWEYAGVGFAVQLNCTGGPRSYIDFDISVPRGKQMIPFPALETYRILVDGAEQGRLEVTEKSDTYRWHMTDAAANGMPHTFSLIKNTERMTIPLMWSLSEGQDATEFSGINIDPRLCTVLPPLPPRGRHLEFIGDSITCGFGNLAENTEDRIKCVVPPHGWHDYEDFSRSIASLTAEAFQAELHTQCVSQVGITRNGNTLKPTTLFNATHYLHRILPTGPASFRGGRQEWNYSQFIPDVAIVNLGTNDYDLAQHFHEQPSLEHFRDNYTHFLTDLVARYKGLPALIIACGPMTSIQCPAVSKAALEVQNAFPATVVRYVRLTLPKDELSGCIGHPNVKGHESLFLQLKPVIQALTGWRV